MIHCRFASLRWRSVWIDGSATFTIVASRMTMNCARQIRTRTTQGFVARRLTTIPNVPDRSGIPLVAVGASGAGRRSEQPAVAVSRRLTVREPCVGEVRVVRLLFGARVVPYRTGGDGVPAPVGARVA